MTYRAICKCKALRKYKEKPSKWAVGEKTEGFPEEVIVEINFERCVWVN